jgi:hypothetical protein
MRSYILSDALLDSGRISDPQSYDLVKTCQLTDQHNLVDNHANNVDRLPPLELRKLLLLRRIHFRDSAKIKSCLSWHL